MNTFQGDLTIELNTFGILELKKKKSGSNEISAWSVKNEKHGRHERGKTPKMLLKKKNP